MNILILTMWILACVLISAVLDAFVPRVSSPLIQIALGVVLAMVFKVDCSILADENLFMVMFIAPLLYNEAQNASKISMARNRVAILSLAIGLVLISTFFVGFTLSALIVTIPLAGACALGAALGPTDAVAVSSLPEDVKIGNRIENILKGESLLNDATGIVCFQFAIAALTSEILPTDVFTTFARLFIGGILFGIIVGFVLSFALQKMQDLGIDNITFHVLFDLLLPFFIYFGAEYFHFSGILSVVAAGIIKSFTYNKIDPILSKTTIVSQSVWSVVVFALNGAVFVMLGLQLPKIMTNLWIDPNIPNSLLVIYVVSIALVSILSRFAWCLFIEHRHNPTIKWCSRYKIHDAALLTFGGPKGAVTLAIVLAIPAVLSNGEAFPGRSILLFIAGGVIIITLILANVMLPILMPKSQKIRQRRDAEQEVDLNSAMIKVLRKTIEELTARQTPETRHATANVVAKYTKRIKDIKSNLNYDDKLNVEARNKALQLERDFVNEQLRAGNTTTHVAFQYLKSISRRQDLLTRKTSISWKIRNWFMRIKAFLLHLPKKTKNIAKSNTLQPGETAMIDSHAISNDNKLDDIYKLRHATMTYVIECLNNYLAQNPVAPAEDIANIIAEYRMHLNAIRSKSPSITTVGDLLDKEEKIYDLGLYLETKAIRDMYAKKEITFSQMKKLSEQVRLMQVAFEQFVD